MNKENKYFAFLLFLMWPFMAVWFALRNYKTTWSKNIIWAFTAFYGYSFAILEGSTSDATRYILSFEKYVLEGNFQYFIGGLYKDSEVDIFQPLIEYLVSRFTDNYKIYFLAIGIIYGYFFSRNIWVLLNKTSGKLQRTSIIIMIVYSFVIPFWQVSGYRWSLAMHIFLFGILNYFILNRKRGLFFIFSSFLVHFSFLLPISSLIIYLIFGNRTFIYFAFFILSFVFTEISGEVLRENTILPELFRDRTESYTDADYIERRIEKMQSANWYVSAHSLALKYTSILLLIFLFFKQYNYIKLDKNLYNFFNFTILYYGFANIVSPYSSAIRFLALAHMLTFAVAFISIQFFNHKLLNRVINFSFPFLLLFLIVKVRIGFDSISITTVFGNPIFALFIERDLPLIDLIK